MRRVMVWYHVATINNWADIHAEQVGKLALSGLLGAAEEVRIGHVGEAALPPETLGKLRVAYRSRDRLEYEIPTIQAMDRWVRELARPEEWAVLYFHTKGAGREDEPSQFNVSFWRRYMEHFVIERWRDCLGALDGCDACGADLNFNPWPHFSGNFWWARAEYLRTLPPADSLRREDPVRAELRIGESSRPMALHSLWDSGLNLYESRYSPGNYRGLPPKMPMGTEPCA
jgi:hypothetical protein